MTLQIEKSIEKHRKALYIYFKFLVILTKVTKPDPVSVIIKEIQERVVGQNGRLFRFICLAVFLDFFFVWPREPVLNDIY